MKYNTKLNKICKDNGFKGSGEVCDLLGIYPRELKELREISPTEFLNSIMEAKRNKQLKKEAVKTSWKFGENNE